MIDFPIKGLPNVPRGTQPPLAIFDTVGHVLFGIGVAAGVLFFLSLLLSLNRSRVGNTIRPYAVRVGVNTAIVSVVAFVGAVMFLCLRN